MGLACRDLFRIIEQDIYNYPSHPGFVKNQLCHNQKTDPDGQAFLFTNNL